MHKIFSIVFVVVAFLSCSQKQSTTTSEGIGSTGDPKNNLHIQAYQFTEIDTTGILLFPLSVTEKETEGSSLAYKKMEKNSFWNMLFLNSRTNEYQLLSDKKILIQNYYIPSSKNMADDMHQHPNYIFYTIVTDDYNKDKKLTNEDPTYLFVSDKFGKNLKQISPGNYNLLNWQFIKTSNKVIMTVQKDSDANSKFEETDEVTTFEIDFEKEAGAKETFSGELKDKLKTLFDRDWKLLKK